MARCRWPSHEPRGEAVLVAVDGMTIADGQPIDVAGVRDVEAAARWLHAGAGHHRGALIMEYVREAAAPVRAGEVQAEGVVVRPLDRAAAEDQVPDGMILPSPDHEIGII